MREYELALVVDSELTSDKQKKLITQIKKEITALKGKVNKADEWGKKNLAYSIGKKTAGVYFLLATQLPESGPAQLEKKLRLQEGLMRYLLVRQEKPAKKGGSTSSRRRGTSRGK